MIDLYAFGTPNSIKVPIALEELGAEYLYHPVNIRQGEQKLPAFLGLNPNGKVPVIVDPRGPDGNPITITESAAILIYLARKFGSLIPTSEIGQVRMFEWAVLSRREPRTGFRPVRLFPEACARENPGCNRPLPR